MGVPVVCGASGGVGTSVIAAALHAFDWDLWTESNVGDVLVCRSTVTSMMAAQQALAAAAYPPVLAVVADVPAASGLPVPPPEVVALSRMLDSDGAPVVSAMVAVPFVPQWRSQPDPVAEAWSLLEPGTASPPWLAGFAAATSRLIEAIQGPLAAAKARSVPVAGTAA